jgi:hypothetical protein
MWPAAYHASAVDPATVAISSAVSVKGPRGLLGPRAQLSLHLGLNGRTGPQRCAGVQAAEPHAPAFAVLRHTSKTTATLHGCMGREVVMPGLRRPPTNVRNVPRLHAA